MSSQAAAAPTLPPAAANSNWRTPTAVFLLAITLVILRGPAFVFHPQFYSEDGSVWYSNAYNLGGFRSLTITGGGYYNTLSRLVAWFALLLPLRNAPLLMNLVGILIQALPAWFLVSVRCPNWGTLWSRIGLAAIYLLLPNTSEVNVVLTNAHFHLALLAVLVAFAPAPPSRAWAVFDFAVLALSALSGPFDIFLLPLLAVYWWMRRNRRTLVVLAILAPFVSIQIVSILLGFATRAQQPLGASALLLVRMVAGHIYFATLFGQKNGFTVRAETATALIVFSLGTAVLAFALWKASLELKLLISYSFLLFAASLTKPLIGGTQPQWQALASDPGARYWFFPTLATAWSLFFCATQRSSKLFRVLGIAALVSMTYGVSRDFRYPPYRDMQFEKYVAIFDAAPVGTTIDFPIYPDGVIMSLTKRAESRGGHNSGDTKGRRAP